jgi:hypothetical protein
MSASPRPRSLGSDRDDEIIERLKRIEQRLEQLEP